ncbi:helix-turn-helix domain-containing protein [Microbulbifer taiwanensis]|uniref:Helix-turn-helix domain-containing protein n=1 Tax=Microbulbifer taiwanensis TaxID=986746 RepID=A0ABW1YGY4_9GAMM|nr:helix-turn-helix transcriptional regulator [Microbulbifer taiwanensis]
MNSNKSQKLLVQLGEDFRRLRLARNIAQDALAADAGVGLSTLKRLEVGRGCNLAALVQLLSALGCAEQFESFFAQLAGGVTGERADPADQRRRASSPRKPAAE